MDEIIYLEPDEEITSVIDKLKALEGSQKSVSLVIPKGAAIIQSVVNLKLLQKEGVSLGKDLSIVTQDRIGRNLASQAGFTVFDNINSHNPIMEPTVPQPKTEEVIELDLTGKKEEEEKVPEGLAVHRYDDSQKVLAKEVAPIEEPKFEPVKKPVEETPIHHGAIGTGNYIPSRDHKTSGHVAKATSSDGVPLFKAGKSNGMSAKKKKIIAIVIGALLVIGGALFYIFYPKAIITMKVKSTLLEKEVEVIVDNNINDPDETRFAVPGELLESEQQGGKKYPTSGKKDVGEKARGTVTISNGSGDSQKVSAGHDLKADSGLIFKTSADVTIPGATVGGGGGIIPGKADVQVEATESGDKYNIGPASFSMSGNLLSGKSANPMSGGSSKQINIVSQNDINSAKDDLKNNIAATTHEDLKKKAGANKIYDSSIVDEIISEETDKKAGDEADEFEIKIKVKSSVISFNEEQFRAMVVKILEKGIPSDQMLSLKPSDEVVTSGSDTSIKEGILKIKGTVKTHTIVKMDINQIKDAVKGKNRVDAENILKAMKDVEKADIALDPSWLIKKIPTREKRIEIKFEYTQ